jgi:phosphoglycerate dehydrogenase-like enzyme
VAVVTAEGEPCPPGLDALGDRAVVRVAPNFDEVRSALAVAEVILLWDFRSPYLRQAWPAAERLEWIHAASAGVDVVLFEELIASDVLVTNSAGVFDQPIAEWVLGAMLALAKDLPGTLTLQRRRTWLHRETERLAGSSALVVGAGGVGRATARLLGSAGVDVCCLARTPRADPELGAILGPADLAAAARETDWLVLALPLTPEAEGMIDAEILASMRPSARLINVARGRLVDEPALVEALRSGRLRGAALDVFASEPLDRDSPLWAMQNVIVSPHMCGDVIGWMEQAVGLFIDNFERRLRGDPLRNLVDKRTGQVSRQ